MKKTSYSTYLKLFAVLALFGHLSACALRRDMKTAPKSEVAEKPTVAETTAPQRVDPQLTDPELQKYAYEIGLDPKKELTDAELLSISKRRKVRQLERTLDSQKERFNYSKILPWLLSDDEKIDYLSIPGIEGRQAWVNKNQIWKRSQNLKEYTEIMEGMDIAAGMPSDFVKKAWGEPDQIEYSGNPIYKNERWKYLKQVSTPNGYRQEKRYVYFEGGRVVGWETE